MVLQSYKSSVCAPCAVLAQTVPGRERGSTVNWPHIRSPLPQPSAGAGQAREAPSLGVSQAEATEHQTHSSGWHLGAQRPGASQRGPWGQPRGGREQSRSRRRACHTRPAGQLGLCSLWPCYREQQLYLESVCWRLEAPCRAREWGVTLALPRFWGEGYSLYLCAPDAGQRGTPELPPSHRRPGLGLTRELRAILGIGFHLALGSACLRLSVCVYCRPLFKNEFRSWFSSLQTDGVLGVGGGMVMLFRTSRNWFSLERASEMRDCWNYLVAASERHHRFIFRILGHLRASVVKFTKIKI